MIQCSLGVVEREVGIHWTLPDDLCMQECLCIWIGDPESKVLIQLSLKFSSISWVIVDASSLTAQVNIFKLVVCYRNGSFSSATWLYPIYLHDSDVLANLAIGWFTKPDFIYPAQKVLSCGESSISPDSRHTGRIPFGVISQCIIDYM